MATATLSAPAPDWDRLADQARFRRRLTMTLLVGFLILTSLPVMLPYFWMLTISLSALT
jgi:hypothetical protein